MTKPHYSDDDFYWDDDVHYDDALEQESTISNSIYSGELLISEIVKQEEKMFCLASYYMLIADIDCGNDIQPPLDKLVNFVNDNGGSFRVYKTKNGMRYLQTDLMYQGANRSAIETLRKLGSDENYVTLCSLGKRFMARLTPKIEPHLAVKYFEDFTTYSFPKMSICHFLKTIGTGKIAPNLSQSVNTHDFFCQSEKNFILY